MVVPGLSDADMGRISLFSGNGRCGGVCRRCSVDDLSDGPQFPTSEAPKVLHVLEAASRVLAGYFLGCWRRARSRLA